MAVVHELGDTVGLHSDPVLVVLDFLGYTDNQRHGGLLRESGEANPACPQFTGGANRTTDLP
jgi:hypothetical protein